MELSDDLKRQYTERMMETWGAKTLEQFRLDALRQSNGIASLTILDSNGQKELFCVCMTGVNQIADFERDFPLPVSEPKDWHVLTLEDIAGHATVFGNGFWFESQWDEAKRRSAFVMVANEATFIRSLGVIFER